MSLKIECNFKAATKPTVYGSEGKTFTKFYCDIDTGSDYPSMAEFQFFGDKLDVSKLKAGQPVTVHFNINGRKAEWEKNGEKKSGFFQSLMAWKIDADAQQVPDRVDTVTPEQDDLPF